MPLEIIETRNVSEIAKHLEGGAHITNGIYGIDKKILLPTTVAFFSYLNKKQSGRHIVIAMNSDKSLKKIKGIGDYASEMDRATILGQPLAHCFPEKKVIILFFDEETPRALYSGLKKHGVLDDSTLHKWGYGTKPNEPAIIGAEFFSEGTVYASPLPFDKKPLCYEQTKKHLNDNITVIDLRENVKAYDDLISSANSSTSSTGACWRFFKEQQTPIAIAAAAVTVAVVAAMVSGGQS